MYVWFVSVQSVAVETISSLVLC